MKIFINRITAFCFACAIVILTVFFFGVGVSAYADGNPGLPVGEETFPTNPSTPSESSALSLDKVDSPKPGRTSWATESRPLGFVVYLNDVSFAENQTKLQEGMTEKNLAKITFTRGEKTATPVLICASKDGVYGKSFFAFFFGGDMVGETLNEYLEGDSVSIAEGCALKCAEGIYRFDDEVEYVYDGKQWTNTSKVEPETIEFSAVGVPVSGITDWGANKGYVGLVLYNEGWSFEENQVNLQNAPWTETSKVTFRRGDTTEECALIAAGLDGSKNISYCAYFFGGDLSQTSLQTGDEVKINGDFAFTTKEGRYSYGVDSEFIYDGTQWIDKSASDKNLTYITYIQEPTEDGDEILFNLKTTTLFSVDDVVTEELKESVLINGVSLKDLAAENKADVYYSFAKIVLSVNKSALKLDDYDVITIRKGAILKGDGSDALRLRDDESFRYSYTLKRTDYIPDYDYYAGLSSMAIIDNIEIAGDTSASTINGVNYPLAHSIWIHFKWAAKTNYDNFGMHLSVAQFVSTGALNEKLCYEYQKLGFFYSVTDLLKVNGKSLYEWMITDAKNGKPDRFKAEYLPYEIDGGRVLRIVVADDSLLDIGMGVDQTVEFKKGFINPCLGEIQKDSVYSIKAEDATMNNKFYMGFKSTNNYDDSGDSGESEQSKSGCMGEVGVNCPFLLFAACVLISAFVLLKKATKEGDK